MSNKFANQLKKRAVELQDNYEQVYEPQAEEEKTLYNLSRPDQVINIRLEDMSENPENIRQGSDWKNDAEMEFLISNIEDIGLQQNLCVRKKTDTDTCNTPYIIVSGHRRYYALKQLHEKYPRIKEYAYPNCIVVDPKKNTMLDSKTSEQVLIVSTNLAVKGLTNEEKIRSVEIFGRWLDEIREKEKEIKAACYNSENGEFTRPLTEEEKEIIDTCKNNPKKRSYIASLLKLSDKSVGNIQQIQKHVIEPFLSAYTKGEISTDTALLLARQSQEVQNEFSQYNNKPINEIQKKDVEAYLKTKKYKSLESKEINVKDRLTKIIKDIPSGTMEFTGEEQVKIMRYFESMEKDISKLLKIMTK